MIRCCECANCSDRTKQKCFHKGIRIVDAILNHKVNLSVSDLGRFNHFLTIGR